jgi:hypothetical protein
VEGERLQEGKKEEKERETHRLFELDEEVAVVAEEERPSSLFRVDADEDAGSLEDGINAG